MAGTAVRAQAMPFATNPPAVTGVTVQLQHPQPIQTQLPTENTGQGRRDRYKKILFGLGITEVILGCICVLFGLAAIIVAAESPSYLYEPYYYGYSYRIYRYHDLTYASQGIWCGLFLVATGTLGIKAKQSPSVCMHKANMALSIISACLMLPLVVLSAIAAVAEAGLPPYYNRLHSLIALHSVIAVIGFIAAILCIVHSAYCCAGVCKCQQQYGDPIAFTAQPYAPQQMVMLPGGQAVPLQMQPNPIQDHRIANTPTAGGQIAYQLSGRQAVIPQMAMQTHGYNEQSVHPQPTQASGIALQPVGYPPKL